MKVIECKDEQIQKLIDYLIEEEKEYKKQYGEESIEYKDKGKYGETGFLLAFKNASGDWKKNIKYLVYDYKIDNNNKFSPQIDYILISNKGIFIFECKNYGANRDKDIDGQISRQIEKLADILTNYFLKELRSKPFALDISIAYFKSNIEGFIWSGGDNLIEGKENGYYVFDGRWYENNQSRKDKIYAELKDKFEENFDRKEYTFSDDACEEIKNIIESYGKYKNNLFKRLKNKFNKNIKQ